MFIEIGTVHHFFNFSGEGKLRISDFLFLGKFIKPFYLECYLSFQKFSFLHIHYVFDV